MKRRRRAPRGKSTRQAPAAGETMTIAAFGRDRHVDEKAVRKAIASTRIPPACLGLRGGRRVIVDVEGARAAWEANVSRPRDPGAGAGEAGRGSLVEASRQATMERFRKLRIENDLREGGVVDVKAARREAFESARVIRETLLNLSVRLAAELAAESDPAKVFARLDDAIREALGAAADRLEAVGE